MTRLAAFALAALVGPVSAQTPTDHAHMAAAPSALGAPGQDAFAAIQEVVLRLEADPNTDWSRINIEALREHLVDMNEVTLRADIRAEPTTTSVRYFVTGSGRTREAIQRMVLAHAGSMGNTDHWTMVAERTSNGAIVIVTPKQPADLVRIRALGLIGMMSDGAHHQAHHWYLATGEGPTAHTH